MHAKVRILELLLVQDCILWVLLSVRDRALHLIPVGINILLLLNLGISSLRKHGITSTTITTFLLFLIAYLSLQMRDQAKMLPLDVLLHLLQLQVLMIYLGLYLAANLSLIDLHWYLHLLWIFLLINNMIAVVFRIRHQVSQRVLTILRLLERLRHRGEFLVRLHFALHLLVEDLLLGNELLLVVLIL